MTRTLALGLLALVVSGSAGAATCPVTAHGARRDGLTDDTAAFRAALAACAESGGTVVVPPGRYRVGAFELPSHTTLRLEAGAELVGSGDPADYPLVETRFEGLGVRGHAALISARGAEDVAIEGEGVIDGRGAYWWAQAEAGALSHPRPRLVELYEVRGARVEGVTLRNSPSWTLHLLYSRDVVVRGVTIEAPPDSPNTDGIDVDSSRDVRISDCTIDTGDDCIALKAGRDEEGRRVGRPTENVTITNCVLRRGHGGLVIGSETAGSIRGVVFKDSVLEGTDRGLRIKTRRGRGGVVEDVLATDLVMRDVAQPVVVNLFYQGDGGTVPEDDTVNEGTPTVRDIRVERVEARGAERAVWLRGLPERPLEGVSLRGLSIEAREGVYAKDVARLSLEDVDLAVADGYALRARRASDLSVVRLRGVAPLDGDAWLELVDVRRALLEGLVAPPAPLAIRVEGEGSGEIDVVGGRLDAAGRAFLFADGADEGALRDLRRPVP